MKTAFWQSSGSRALPLILVHQDSSRLRLLLRHNTLERLGLKSLATCLLNDIPWYEKKTFGSSFTFTLCITATSIGCDSNHETTEHPARLPNDSVTIEVEYIQDTCDPFTPRLFYKPTSDAEPIPILLALPANLKAPRNSDYAVQGNHFLLKGFLYEVSDNKLGQRMDVVAWKAISPIEVWSGEIPPKRVKLNKEMDWVQLTNNDSQPFVMQKYNSCY